MTLSFVERLITVNFTLAKGLFGDGKGNTKVVNGLRTEVTIEKNGHPSKNKLKIAIYGMLQEDMNTLTTFSAKPLAVRKNYVQVLAGDSGNMPVAFEGDITGAWAVYKSPPNLYFHVEAMAGYYPAIVPAAPRSYAGPMQVRAALIELAQKMGYAYEDSGTVVAILENVYLHGSAYQQAASLADMANLEFGIDDGVMFVAPRGTPRPGQVPLISAATGMKEYPVFDKKGISVTTLYDPAIKLGGLVVVNSDIKQACGTWRVHGLKHHLDSLKPNGKWESEIKASLVGS